MNATVAYKLRVMSRNEMPFVDRAEAGLLLAQALRPFKGPQTVVLGVPRGGLVVACQVARHLEAPLDIILSKKLSAPHDPQWAVGSVAENGQIFVDHRLAHKLGVNPNYFQKEGRKIFTEIQRQRDLYRDIRPKIDLKDKDVIVVDDGVATGSTALAALWSVRQENPRHLIGVFPVGPQEALLRLCEAADEVFCLKVPAIMEGVSRFYLNFDQVSQEDVLAALIECGGIHDHI